MILLTHPVGCRQFVMQRVFAAHLRIRCPCSTVVVDQETKKTSQKMKMRSKVKEGKQSCACVIMSVTWVAKFSFLSLLQLKNITFSNRKHLVATSHLPSGPLFIAFQARWLVFSTVHVQLGVILWFKGAMTCLLITAFPLW